MTTLIGYKGKDSKGNDFCYVAGDGQSTKGWLAGMTDPKGKWTILPNGVVYGLAGEPRFKQLVDAELIAAEKSNASKMDIINKIDASAIPVLPIEEQITGLCDKLGELASRHNFLTNESNESPEMDSALIVFIGGRLFEIDTNFSWFEPHDGLVSLGSGRSYALGAIHALNPDPTIIEFVEVIRPILQLKIALSAAARFDISTGSPFVIYDCLRQEFVK